VAFFFNALRDSFVNGLSNNSIQLELMSELAELTFEKTCNSIYNVYGIRRQGNKEPKSCRNGKYNIGSRRVVQNKTK